MKKLMKLVFYAFLILFGMVWYREYLKLAGQTNIVVFEQGLLEIDDSETPKRTFILEDATWHLTGACVEDNVFYDVIHNKSTIRTHYPDNTTSTNIPKYEGIRTVEFRVTPGQSVRKAHIAYKLYKEVVAQQ